MVLAAYLKRQRKLLLLLAGIAAVFAAVLSLYDLPVEAVGYAALLCLVLGIVLFIPGFCRFRARHQALRRLLAQAEEPVLPLPPAADLLEEDYQALLTAVAAHRMRLLSRERDKLEDMTDYYTLWAHQIKTPMAAASLLLQEDPPPREALEAELLKIGQYVDMVLGYLRLDSDSTDYVFEATDLNALVRQAVRKFARLFILKHITLDFGEMDWTVLTDGKWLSFVVEQLLSNALKYTPAGGHITLSAALRDGMARLSVQDEGQGIDAGSLPHVFDRFYRTDQSRARQTGGTGLGLAIAKWIVDRHGGWFEVRSWPGVGTRMTIVLPVAELDAGGADEDAEQTRPA